MKLISVLMPEPYLKAMQELVDAKLYPNKAELIRTAVRDLLTEEAWGRKTWQKGAE